MCAGFQKGSKSSVNADAFFSFPEGCVVSSGFQSFRDTRTSLILSPQDAQWQSDHWRQVASRSRSPGSALTSVPAATALSSDSVMVFLTPSCTRIPRLCTTGSTSAAGRMVMWKVSVTWQGRKGQVGGTPVPSRTQGRCSLLSLSELSSHDQPGTRSPAGSSPGQGPPGLAGAALPLAGSAGKGRSERASPLGVPCDSPTPGEGDPGSPTSLAPSDSAKLKASERRRDALECTYWMLPEARSACVKEATWRPGEGDRAREG